MSIAEFSVPVVGIGQESASGVPQTSSERLPLHRLATVRRQQGVSRRTMARRLNVDANTVRTQEDEASDIPLSTLRAWQAALEVPLSELLVDSDDPLSEPILKRAKMVRLMKTAQAILERSRQPGIHRMAQMLVEQLTELMPELAGVSPWHTVGKRRSREELGRAAERTFSMEVFRVLPE